MDKIEKLLNLAKKIKYTEGYQYGEGSWVEFVLSKEDISTIECILSCDYLHKKEISSYRKKIKELEVSISVSNNTHNNITDDLNKALGILKEKNLLPLFYK